LDEELETIQALLTDTGLGVCNFIPAQYRYPSILCSENERVRSDSVAYIRQAMDNAVSVGAGSVSLCPGMVLFDQDIEKGWRQLRRSLRELEEYSRDTGLFLLLEPAHRYESNLIQTVEQALRMIDELKTDRIGVLMDSGHCHLNGEDFHQVVSACGGLPLHIHLDDNLADSDSHLIPGQGNADLAGLADALKTSGYEGFVSAELGAGYFTDPSAACERALESMRRLFCGRLSG
jgi:protein FrlC